MKKTLWIAVPIMLAAACIAGIAAIASPLQGKHLIKASGNIVTKEITIPDFNAINTSRAVKVVLTQQGDKIRIDADDNLMAWVIVEPEDNELQVTIDREIKSINDAHVTVTIPVQGRTFRALKASSAAQILGQEIVLQGSNLQVSASSAASIEIKVQAKSCSVNATSAAHVDLKADAPKCLFDATSAAKIQAEVESQSCSASASSAAHITLKGRTDYFEGDSSSAGKINADSLAAARASAKASSASGISVNCAEKLEAHASSGAAIRYSGDCQIDASKSSGGSIRKK